MRNRSVKRFTLDAKYLAVATAAGALAFAEFRRPLRARRIPVRRRALVNASLGLSAAAVSTPVVNPLSRGVSRWATSRKLGIVPNLPIGLAGRQVAGFLLLDASFYAWHRLNHASDLLWRFHNVHHTDPELDGSTAVRFHFGELFASAAMRAVQSAVLGPGPGLLRAYDLVFAAANAFHHANIDLPFRLDSIFQPLFITPRLHGTHHSFVRQETNANFGVVFSIWDRILRTFHEAVRQDTIRIGVPAYSTPGDNQVSFLLSMPFRRQRDYFNEALASTLPS